MKYLSGSEIINNYMNEKNWRVKENSNAGYSFGALNKHIISKVSKNYWLEDVYNDKILKSYTDGDIHIHDLGGLSVYCCGYSIRKIIQEGIHGLENIPTSKPAKHFGAILSQIANITTIFQNEIMGAVAFSSIDTFLAPFIKEDSLTYSQVKQCLQNFIFAMNSNSRGGAEAAFSNITLDLTPSKDIIDFNVLVGGDYLDYTYRDCQEEMDVFNKVFCEIMIEGDGDGRPFSYPIPTYNINDRFDWDNKNNTNLWEMAGKYGYPYFANFMNSDMNPEDCRSMCCRLRINKRELEKRNGGLFGSGDSTGSIGVVTLNLPRYGYVAKSKRELFEIVEKNMKIAKDSLVIKRKFLQEMILEKGLIPAFDTYVGTLKNHFNTIGLVGLNEMCLNLIDENIVSENGKKLSIEIIDFMREKLSDFQEETGELFNLEATPAESTVYRFAKKDVEKYKDIITSGDNESPYYTNSCHIPVNEVESIKQVCDHQEDLQIAFTGGTVIHIFMDGPICGDKAKKIIKTICTKYKVPYISLSPINRCCKKHGYIDIISDNCPVCGEELDVYQRITGYIRNIKNFNPGKRKEFYNRNQLHE